MDTVKNSLVAGRCYSLSRGPWKPRLELGIDTIYIRIPAMVRFDTRRVLDPFGEPDDPIEMWLLPATGARYTVHGPGKWHSTVSGREVSVRLTTGFSGLTMSLVARDAGATLTGEARSFWDFGRKTQKASISGKRIACNS